MQFYSGPPMHFLSGVDTPVFTSCNSKERNRLLLVVTMALMASQLSRIRECF
jgi:hypothetical protein